MKQGEQAAGLFGLNRAQIKARLQELGVKEGYRAEQLYRAFYGRRITSYNEITELPKALIAKLEEHYPLPTLSMAHESISEDGTRKYLFTLADGLSIETVLIPSEMRDVHGESRRRTLCISTQVGCPLDCKFCATATLKVKRNLSVAEILLQVFEVERITGEPITNLVYMGMGEPMLNYENVVASLRIITDPDLEILGKKRVTVSTSGLPDEIRRFAHEGLNVKLALSLHATTNDLRSKLMPINLKFPIEEVLSAMEEYYRETHIPVTYEYILFEDLNDTPADAKRLARIARRMPSKVNVIPFHPIDFAEPVGLGSELRPASAEAFDDFLTMLRELDTHVMIRSSSGQDIEAACGQLALSDIAKATGLHGIALHKIDASVVLHD